MSQPTKQAALEYALDRLVHWARTVSAAGNIKFSGDHPLAVAEALLATPSPLPASTDLAHELWSAAQLAPGEGVEDGVRRIAGLLPTAAEVEERAGLVESCFNLTDSLEWTTRHSCEGNASADDVAEVRDALRDAIDRLASSAAQVPDGWQLVPKEPTDPMIDAAEACSNEWPRTTWKEAWSAMLAAAPAAPMAAQVPEWDSNPEGVVDGEESGPRMDPNTGVWEEPETPGELCAACDGTGRVDSPNECLRCGMRGCQTDECAACNGTGEAAAAAAGGGQ